MGDELMSTETFAFKSEAKQLLQLMIHSLYSTKDIFLRELISNASDALDKLRFESLTDSTLVSDDQPLKIEIIASGGSGNENEEGERTLTIRDNGIGMSKEEMISHLGTIAQSGTKEFLDKIQSAQTESQEAVNQLIGQFGVGFYSSFIVSADVSVLSRSVGSEEAWLWRSTGDGEFTIEPAEKDHAGTEITLSLRSVDDEDGLEDFTQEWTIRNTVKRYSDFVQYPIELWVKKSKPYIADEDEDEDEAQSKEPEPYWEWEQVNSMKAIWTRSPSEVSDEEYQEFYKHISKDWNEFANKLRFHVEGMLEFTGLLFLPSKVPFNLNYRDQKHGLQLYANRVMIMENCEDILPAWLRFMKGVIDSSDLSLNVSREILQQDRHVRAIKKSVTSKSIKHLKNMLADERENYVQVWENFGEVLKESVIDYANSSKVQPLFMFKTSTQEEYTTLDEYIERMDEEQEFIYYITGESIEAIERSPHLEAFKEREVEVLYMTQAVDEWMVGSFTEYEGKKLRSVGQGEVELGSEEERKAAEEERKNEAEASEELLKLMQSTLDSHIKEVRLSSRLTNSPACLVGDQGDMTPGLERMMAQMGQEAPKSKRILELNPKHDLYIKLKDLHTVDSSDNKLAHYVHLLYGQALIAEGSPMTEPVAFNEALTQVMIS
jgi:molecular chaperone HtpG